MYKAIDLSGKWRLAMNETIEIQQPSFQDSIDLPNTTSYCSKGKKNDNIEIGCLTDEYQFEGYAWYSRDLDIPEDLAGKKLFVYLERTRMTTLLIDGKTVGTQNSLCTPHCYDVTPFLRTGKHTITVRVDNVGYPTKGGHLTSPDSQSNWNGITGRLELRAYNSAYISDVQVYPCIQDKTATVKLKISGATSGTVSVRAESFNGTICHSAAQQDYQFSSGEASLVYLFGEDALLWSEHNPNLYHLNLALQTNGVPQDTVTVDIGLREFAASKDKFTINGMPAFLRGKHDSLNFPKTGYAPTTVEEWLRVLKISQSYGINHYRFHTCCPPEAAFTAADLLGVYLEPELPFWGTVKDENDPEYNGAEQDYLVEEGFRILKTFGNHPSFVMFSLGNELWGSKERLNEILRKYKQYDCRHLYTQGSNNFQFTPCILENDDFFAGVRFSRDRLFRGSYAMCDAPLGHVQTDLPGTLKDYDREIIPDENQENSGSSGNGGLIQIQVGTEAKTVKAEDGEEQLVPEVPVVSHEIGQYAVYPNFKEIEKYTGPLKAKNFEVFRDRLAEKGMADLAAKFFQCSGKLSAACYKDELETAFRSRKLAGFQLLDLQDYSGQGTALVGMLDAFMDSKGLITPEEWRSFCSDTVLLARFPKYNYEAGETFSAHVELCRFHPEPLKECTLKWVLKDEQSVYESGEKKSAGLENQNYFDLCDICFKMPEISEMRKLTFSLEIKEQHIQKDYSLWVYPSSISADVPGINVFEEYSAQAEQLLQQGKKVVVFTQPKNSIEGFYCSDFWCYPMFRSISESMNKEVPVGTMGLYIQNNHPALKYFPCEEYSTYPWWNIVQHSRSAILDETPNDFRPVVQTIDNFERNHKLGLLFECKAFGGRLLVCTCEYEKLTECPEGRQFLSSILNYAASDDFKPTCALDSETLKNLLQ